MMMLERIGTMGRTQGVKVSPKPAAKKSRSAVSKLPSASRLARTRSSVCTATGEPPDGPPASPPDATWGAPGRVRVTHRVSGG